MLRVVRLGRAANDNARLPGRRARIFFVSITVVGLALLANWLL
jgi:hypothetical protein